MRIHSVTMTGFGPFIEKTTVDFDQFRDDGIFVISGPTGAGKSSILDAVTFALYGWVPRYAQPGLRGSVRNRVLDSSQLPTEVVVEISHGDKRYRILRRPEWTKPGNKTPTPQYAEIAQIIDGQEHVEVARRVRDVSEKIFEVVKLDATQFSQVVLLAQGEFQKFLVASSEDRKSVLRRLFATRRFEDWTDEISRRAKTLSAELAVTHTQIETLLRTIASGASAEGLADDDLQSDEVRNWLATIAQLVDADVTAATEVAERADQAAEKAAGELETIKNLRKRQEQRAEAEQCAADLATKHAGIEAARTELEAANRAALAMPFVNALTEAEAAKTDALETLNATEDELRSSQMTSVIEGDLLAETIDEKVAEAARLADLIKVEVEFSQLEEEGIAAEAAEKSADEEVERTTKQITAAEQRTSEILASLVKLRPIADSRAETERRVERLTVKVEAAEQVTSLQAAWREAAQRQQDNHEQLLALETQLGDLQRRRLEENAGHLAQELRAGTPCKVCGSTEHPKPAVLVEDAVSDAQLAELRKQVEQKRHRDTELSAVETETKTKFATAQTAADGDEVEQLTQALEAANADHEEAHAAHLEVNRLDQERAELDEKLSELRSLLDDQRKAAGAAKLKTSRLNEKTQTLSKQLVEARGAHRTVRDHHERVKNDLNLLRSYLAARQQVKATTETHATAIGKLETACAEQGFADTDDVTAAHRSVDQRNDLAQLIRDHESEEARVAGILAQPDLQGLPSELVDPTGAQNAYTEAKQARDSAHADLGSQRARAETLATQAAQIERLLSQNVEATTRRDVLKRLADTMNGQGPNERKMSLESYVLAGDLEDIIDAANQLLRDMTNSRFQLALDDSRAGHGAQSGLGLHVHDAWNDELRPPESLSGGEKFQASLALALGLAEVVTSRSGGVRLDTLFIDEGFGSLDPETLDEVLGTIDGLRRNGRTVGLISHVAAVKERISGHIEVSTSEQNGSSIRIRQP